MAVIPLQPLRANRDAPESAEGALLLWLDRIEREGKQWQDAANMDRWERWLTAYGGGNKQVGSVKFQAPVIRPTIDRRNALLTENKPAAKILPWRNGLEQLSETLEKLFDADWHATGMQMGIEEMVQVASVLGSAGIDLAWNPAAQFGQGGIEATVLDPRQVIFDPIVRKSRMMDKALYVRIETVKNIWDLQREYPGRGMLVTPDAGLSTTVSGGANQILTPAQSVSAQISTNFRARQRKLEEGPVPRKLCQEYWVRDPRVRGTGEPDFPRGRQIERAGTVILDDNHNPYWDGLWPIEWFDLIGDIDSAWGRSQVDSLRYVAESINRIGDLFVQNSILAGNVVVVHDSDAMTNETRAKLINAAALVVPKKFGRTVEWRPPPPMPPHMLQFISFGLRLVDYLVGLNDGQLEGRGRIEMRSGVQLEGLQNAAQILVKSSARRLEAFLERLGQKWLSRVFQFYTGNRLQYYLGNDNDYKKYQFDYGQIQSVFQQMVKTQGLDSSKAESLKDMMMSAWRQFAFKIKPMSSLAANKVARAQLLAQLAETGRFPFGAVLREVGFDNSDDLMQQAQQEIQKYGPPTPPTKKAGKK